MKVTYFGHSAFQIELGADGGPATTLLVDPFITGNGLAEGAGVKAADLEPDVVLLTHAHGDHWGDTVAIVERTGALVVAQFEVVQYLERAHGYTNAHPMNTGGTWVFDWGRVTQTYARHSSSFPDGTYGGLCSGFILEAEEKTVYNSGDTCAFAEMAWIGEDYDLDLAFLPIGDDFTMGPKEAARCVEMLRPKLVVPVHYNTFPLIRADPQDFARRVGEAGFEARVLAPGEALTL
jgi:L-ascorbate metabolism protein UlaG (beta-lactamase superfamily)